FLKNQLKPQPLLVSMTIKARAEEISLVLESLEFFKKMGFEIEPFGENSLIVRSVPQGLEPSQVSVFLKSLIEELKSAESSDLIANDPSRISPKLERILATAACHGSVRAGQALSYSEAKALVDE